MKTEIIKQINVKLERDDKEPINKVIALINKLLYTGDRHGCKCYKINDTCRHTNELENLIEFLNSFTYADVIELT